MSLRPPLYVRICASNTHERCEKLKANATHTLIARQSNMIAECINISKLMLRANESKREKKRARATTNSNNNSKQIEKKAIQYRINDGPDRNTHTHIVSVSL